MQRIEKCERLDSAVRPLNLDQPKRDGLVGDRLTLDLPVPGQHRSSQWKSNREHRPGSWFDNYPTSAMVRCPVIRMYATAQISADRGTVKMYPTQSTRSPRMLMMPITKTRTRSCSL